MRPDANIISGNGEYFVTSLYYDSYDLSDYHDKIGGFIKRKKSEPGSMSHIWISLVLFGLKLNIDSGLKILKPA